MPVFRLGAFYSVVAGDDPGRWTFSSDAMTPGEPAGSTYHADYLEGWNPATKAEWTNHCINGFLSCVSGNLGDGKMLKGADQPPYGLQRNPNRLLPVNQVPTTPMR